MTNRISVNGRDFEVVRRTKWTLDAVCITSGNPIASGSSKPKLIQTLEKLFPEAPEIDTPTISPAPEVEAPVEDAKAPAPIKTPPKKPVDKAPKKESMRSLVISMMLSGADDDEVLSRVTENFPDTKFDMTHVKWYRSTFAKSGIIGAQFAPKRSSAYKNWLKSNS